MSVPRRRTANMHGDRPVYDPELPRDPDTPMHLAEAIKAHATAEARRAIELAGVSLWDDDDDDPISMLRDLDRVVAADEDAHGMAVRRFELSDEAKLDYLAGADPYAPAPSQVRDTRNNGVDDSSSSSSSSSRRDLISSICQNIELAVELGKHLGAADILSLYRANRAFYHAVNSYLMSSVRAWIAHHCPDAALVFNFRLYKRHLTADPAGRTWSDHYPSSSSSSSSSSSPRTVPGLRYLQLVMGRDRYCRDMVSLMARNGHPLPRSTHGTLLRLWLLLELATSQQRQALLRNASLWTDAHLYNAQLLFMKLGLLFNDPVYGPSSWDLLHLVLGQKGLFPLWQLLARKRFKTLPEILALRVRYDLQLPPDHVFAAPTYHGVPPALVGTLHLEGWGLGHNHLLRPDELVPVEAVARGLHLDAHLLHMMLWGLFDWRSGDNYVPSAQDLRVADETALLAAADTSHHWNLRHAAKKRFAELPAPQQRAILAHEEDTRLRAIAWCGDVDDYEYEYEEQPQDTDTPTALDDEMERGFIVLPPQQQEHAAVPGLHGDTAAWAAFVDEALLGAVPEVDEDEKLRMENWNNYHPSELDSEWDWAAWLAQQGSTSSEDEPYT